MHASTIKVLLVDDNLINLKLMVNYLNGLRCEVDTAGNGIEALSKLEKNDYNIVFMDCKMPKMDGYEATERIRLMDSDKSDSLIVALTANTQQGHRDFCLKSGMNDFVSKPVSMKDIKDLMSKYFEVVF